MSENSNVALHKKIHQAALNGDMQTLTDMIAGDVVWHSPGRSHVSGDFYGRESVMTDFFGKMDELSQGTAGFEDFQAYFGSGDYSAALFRSATITVIWLVLFMIGVALPRALGTQRFILGPSPTVSSLMYRSSTSIRPSMFTALETADRISFPIVLATGRGV